MANYRTISKIPGLHTYYHNSSASSSFQIPAGNVNGTFRYPSISQVSAAGASGNTLALWIKTSPFNYYQNPWFTGFEPGSAYQLFVEGSNANIVQEGDTPGYTIRKVYGPLYYLAIPANAYMVPLSTCTVTTATGTVSLTALLAGNNAASRILIPNATADNWNSYIPNLPLNLYPGTPITKLEPGSAYYIDLGLNPDFTINIPRRNSYLITNDYRFIITNNGNYITVQQSL